MAVKKSATKVAKTGKKTPVAASGKTAAAGTVKATEKAVKRPVASKTPAAAKPVAKSPSRTAAASKAAAKKKVASTIDSKPIAKKTTTKSAAVKKAPVAKKSPAKKAVVKKEASTSVAAAKPAPAKKAPARKAAVKKVAKAPAKTVAPAKEPVKSAAPAKRRLSKVAVAVVGKSQPPAVKTKFKVVPHKIDKASGRPIVPKDYFPSVDEEYMSALQLEYFRQRLLQWRDDLVEESKQTIENLKDEVRDVGDEAERATRETENSLELRTRDRYRKLISKIDSTLKRVDTGDYGYCVDTGEEIGLERLDARLTAERTIDAQERWEHLRKQMGD
ncbi:RNA polymerase-binding protein DksA [Lysobacter ciconiae]|uniref:RNA polymerase-binding transcription factor DksA n=1 Tax=Novilysobacter ciconiae TaxID=2781022 RepID=A0A7S6ZTC3_9GAMM|nr:MULTISPECIES: RNA polymerase-binding protein DksA [Lysobacter]QOW20793.1 RNA polymerase-binding protein DksA [Lysobacter ciconiae]QOY63999.1 RNA polymerase-binding protein DksA [Lysobacter sp. H21R4]